MTAGDATVKGVEIEIDAEAVVVRFDELLPVVSWAPAGGSAANSSPAPPVQRRPRAGRSAPSPINALAGLQARY